MSFLYPPALVEQIKDRWLRFQSPRMVVPVAVWNPETKRMQSVPENERVPSLEPRHAAPPALPEDGALALLLEVVYHASFLTEEGRRLGLRVIYLPPASPEDRRDVIGKI